MPWITMAPELTYRDDFSSPRDRATVYALLRDVFDVDVSLLEEMDLWDPTYRASPISVTTDAASPMRQPSPSYS